ncbi:hypothetical protein QZH41_019203, partial [Actinostola sp. cb2023]
SIVTYNIIDEKRVGLANMGNYPYGKDMYGESLRMALTSLFEEYATDIAVKKIAPAENSQRNESLNNTIGSKILKIR